MTFFPGDIVKFTVDNGDYVVTSTYNDGECDIHDLSGWWDLTVDSRQLKKVDQSEWGVLAYIAHADALTPESEG